MQADYAGAQHIECIRWQLRRIAITGYGFIASEDVLQHLRVTGILRRSVRIGDSFVYMPANEQARAVLATA